MNKTFTLKLEICDEIAELITEFCQGIGVDRKDILKYRLSAEECLLYWINQGLEGRKVSLQMGRFMFTPFISLEAESNRSLNPFTENREKRGLFAENLLVNLGLDPEYSYNDGTNRVRFRIKKKSPNQIAVLCMVLATAMLIGICGKLFIPDGIRDNLLELLINPLYDTFFKLLGCVAGPMIFMSVAWGVYGIGDAATFGKIGRKMMLFYTLITFLAALICSVYFPILGPKLSSTHSSGGQFKAITEMLFDIIPPNLVEPFMSGNTLQIIFMSVVIGIALLYLGRQTTSLANAISQVNTLIQFLMQFISRMVPYVIFLVVISLIWAGKLAIVLTAWKLIVAVLSSLVLLSALYIAVTSVRMKVSPLVLVAKSIPTFLIALVTASSAASFGSLVETCEKKFGIDPSLIRFGIPLGIVIHMPLSAAYDLLMVFYFARHYNISCSVSWICIAVFICTIIAIATPPIPGGGTIAYSALFQQLGIPMEALAVALAIDIISDFILTAFEMLVLPISLINISSGMGMIDEEVLRRAE